MTLIETYSRPREGRPIPLATTITLPDGSDLTVGDIPYDGWGIAPGKIYRVTEHDDDGAVIWERSWAILETTESLPA